MSSEYLAQVREIIGANISSVINNTNLIEKSMAYSSLSDSKMVRAGLVLASSELNKNVSKSSAITLATAVELMHTYSLIHDDLPCMDDDKWRRNQPSNHIKFGEANAVLTGDALQALAYEIICEDKDLSNTSKVNAVKSLSKACGKKGMVLGQQLDLENEQNSESIELRDLEYINSLKTGKLIECSVLLGSLENLLDISLKDGLREYGKKIGLAFQIIDDILDVLGDKNKLGKEVNSDKKNKKITYIELIGVDASKEKASDLIKSAISIINSFDVDNKENLIGIANYIINRDK